MRQERMNILLTGQPGVGKTTAIKTIVSYLKPGRVSGFWTTEIRQAGKRVGFAIETLSGKRGILAYVDIKGPRVGKYGVNIENIDSIIVPELRIARESGKLIIIDEIAKMELYSHRFSIEVEACLDTGKVLGTIQARNYPFLNKIRSRRDVKVIEITESNRDKIPTSVYDTLKLDEMIDEN
jgi:nucleoside-triphosphatase